jgi:predicted DsbA family dithiol-disulfide isomerase
VLCLGTHIANFLIAPILWRLRPAPVEPVAPPAPAKKGAPPPSPPVEPDHPAPALGLTALALVAALWVAEWKSYRALHGSLQGDQIAELRDALDELSREMAQYSEIASDIERLDGLHLGQEPLDLGLRPDDPKIDGGRGQRMQVVVFSDIECPNCARFHEFLFGEMLPLFSGHLEVVFKHFPLGEHKNALPGAKALEAARAQGNEEYWELHHWLSARREQLGSVDWRAAAQAVGLDEARFLADMGSPETMRRIQEDIAKGRALGLTGTPAVFLNGRPVNRVIRSNIGWWKLKADVLRAARERANQPW